MKKQFHYIRLSKLNVITVMKTSHKHKRTRPKSVNFETLIDVDINRAENWFESYLQVCNTLGP